MKNIKKTKIIIKFEYKGDYFKNNFYEKRYKTITLPEGEWSLDAIEDFFKDVIDNIKIKGMFRDGYIEGQYFNSIIVFSFFDAKDPTLSPLTDFRFQNADQYKNEDETFDMDNLVDIFKKDFIASIKEIIIQPDIKRNF